MDASDDRVRLDKWLWAARFFKTRGAATEAVLGGRVQLNGQSVKPSKDVHVDDEVDIGHFVAQNVQTIPDIQDTRTIITFKAF